MLIHRVVAVCVAALCVAGTVSSAAQSVDPARIAALFVSAGVLSDGGGFWIDGKGHIHRVPPWDPPILAEFSETARLLDRINADPSPRRGARSKRLPSSARRIWRRRCWRRWRVWAPRVCHQAPAEGRHRRRLRQPASPGMAVVS